MLGLTAVTFGPPLVAGLETIETLCDFGAEAGGAGAGADASSSLSGCSISKLLADSSLAGGDSLGVRGFDSGALGALTEAGAGVDATGAGAVSDRIGVVFWLGSAAEGAWGAVADRVGVAMGAEDAETALVSKSMTFGLAFFPPNHSDADRAASIDGAGGKMLTWQINWQPNLAMFAVLTQIGSYRTFVER